MEKIKFGGGTAEKKLEVQDLRESDLEKILEDLRTTENQLEVSERWPDIYAAKIKNIRYTSAKFDLEEEEGYRYDVMAFREDKGGGETLIASTQAYADFDAAEKIYKYLGDLYRRRKK